MYCFKKFITCTILNCYRDLIILTSLLFTVTVLETSGIGTSVNNRSAGKLESALTISKNTSGVNKHKESYEIMNNFRKNVKRSLDRNKQFYKEHDNVLLQSTR